MNTERQEFIVVGLLALVALVGLVRLPLVNTGKSALVAALAYRRTITAEQLQVRHDEQRLKVLIVPGHDNDYSGTSFGDLREADLTLEAAGQLQRFLVNDPHFTVYLARDLITGEYVPELAHYFVNERDEIDRFRAEHREKFNELAAGGDLELQTGVYHGFAKEEVAARLYGINKWANEQQIDVVIHLHFNDYPGRSTRSGGKYSGFAVYVPERQYPNSGPSIELGKAISEQLQKYFALSDLPQEAQTVTEDQDLIAIGAQGTRQGASILIEYGYIYEPQFTNPAVRQLILPEMAWQTYQGLKHYFDPVAGSIETSMLPLSVDKELRRGMKGEPEVLSLQKLLHRTGFYPPTSRTLRDCPLNGNFGPCVELAVSAFQTAHSLPATGVVGELTQEALNQTPQ
jgi:N-acetylmuramoyl-L-alanine amidase